MSTCIKTAEERLSILTPTYLEIQDDSADHIGHRSDGAGHVTIRINSPIFKGLSRLAIHRAVYDALGDLIPEKIHACRIEVVG